MTGAHQFPANYAQRGETCITHRSSRLSFCVLLTLPSSSRIGLTLATLNAATLCGWRNARPGDDIIVVND